jgi:hypothetical protein
LDRSAEYKLYPSRLTIHSPKRLRRSQPRSANCATACSNSKGPEFPMSRCRNRCNASWKISTTRSSCRELRWSAQPSVLTRGSLT